MKGTYEEFSQFGIFIVFLFKNNFFISIAGNVKIDQITIVYIFWLNEVKVFILKVSRTSNSFSEHRCFCVIEL